jgi:hypothetical protein
VEEGWPVVWPADAGPPVIAATRSAGSDPGEEGGGVQLRSVNEMIGSRVQGSDDRVGHVDDFIVDGRSWEIPHIVVETRHGLPSKRVLLSRQQIEREDWPESRLHIGLTAEGLEACPEFDPASPVNREEEARLYDYYGRLRRRAKWAQLSWRDGT